MQQTNCEINLILTLYGIYIILSTDVANQGASCSITDTKLYAPVVTLSTEDNAKLLQQLDLVLKVAAQVGN